MIAIAVVLNYLCQAILVGGMKQYTRRKPHLWNTLLMKRKVFHNLIHTIPAILVYALLPMAFMRGKELLLISQKACAIYIIFSLLLAINGGGAKGVAIKLYEHDQTTAVSLGKTTAKQTVTPGSSGGTGTADLEFYADYVSTAATVTAGKADGTANFNMIYN